jgi:hypothetical protein
MKRIVDAFSQIDRSLSAKLALLSAAIASKKLWGSKAA